MDALVRLQRERADVGGGKIAEPEPLALAVAGTVRPKNQ